MFNFNLSVKIYRSIVKPVVTNIINHALEHPESDLLDKLFYNKEESILYIYVLKYNSAIIMLDYLVK